ncbi:hypothetical protein EBZ35_04230 [bacterium]|nr:hypothetical protein [bacterium]
MINRIPAYHWMDQVGGVYSELFAWVYPYVHSHLVSYGLIVLVCGVAEWQLWKRFSKRRPGLSKGVIGLALLVLGSYIGWLVLYHFHTYAMADHLFMTEPAPPHLPR